MLVNEEKARELGHSKFQNSRAALPYLPLKVFFKNDLQHHEVGAVKIGSGEILGKEVDNCDRNTMINFLDLLLEHEKDSSGPIYVILDNAKPHRAKAVQLYIEEKARRIHLIFLPSY